MDMFPNLQVVFENIPNNFGEYDLDYSRIVLPVEILKNDVPIFKETLHHELQHAQDPRIEKIPEKIRAESDEANLANYIGLVKIDDSTQIPSYEEIVEKIFHILKGRESTKEDEEFLNKIKEKYTPEKYEKVIRRLKAGDHPYFNSELEKPANLKDFKRMFSISKLMGVKDLVSKSPEYTNQKHIKTIINVLKNPSSDKFKTLETLLVRNNPEFSETYDPSFLKDMNTNPKYEKQFKKQLGNIINELQQLLKEN